jgi:hypothetical protein
MSTIVRFWKQSLAYFQETKYDEIKGLRKKAGPSANILIIEFCQFQ